VGVFAKTFSSKLQNNSHNLHVSVKLSAKAFYRICRQIQLGPPSGLEVIDDLLTSAVKKLSFVSIWFSFCVALFLLNR
jgi:hypothetical protein